MRQRGITFGMQKGILACLLLLLILTPITHIFGQDIPTGPSGYPSIDSYVEQYTNNPGNPNAPGYFGDPGGSTGSDTGDSTTNPGSGSAGGFDSDGFISSGGEYGSEGAENVESQDPLPYVQKPSNVVDSFVYYAALRISGWVLRLGGAIFDTAYESFVLKLGCWFVAGEGCTGSTIGNGQVGGVVNELWEMVRDMFNIAFIFALIYIGIRTILFTEDSSTRRMLGLLIAAALLINFSLYIAKTIVDLANFTAVQLHQNMVGKVTGSYLLEPNIEDINVSIGFAENSIAGGFMTVLGYSSFFGTDPNDVGEGYVILFSLMLLVFSFILAFTFAYAGLMLLFRFIAIVFYLIFSPLMFLAWVVPQFASAGKKWWSGFLGYAFYAPVFIFLIFLTLYVLQAFEGVAGGFADPDFSAGFASNHSAIAMNAFIFFTVAVGFIIASTKVADSIAKQSGAIGMATANKWSKRVTTGAGAAAGAWVGGRAASTGLGWAGKGVEKASNRVPGALGGSNVRRFGENLQKAKIGGASSFKERADATKEHNKKRGDAATERKLAGAVSAGTAKRASSNDLIALERGIADASTTQLENLGTKKLADTKVAGSLSTSQFDAVMKSDKFSDTEKGKIANARKKAVETKLYDNQNRRTKIEDASTAQLEALGSEFIENNAENLTPGQLDELKKKMTESEFGRIKKANKDALIATISSQNADAAFKKPDGSWKKDKDIAQMPADVLNHPNAVYHMNANILRNILDKETLNANDRAVLKQNIEDPANWNQFSSADKTALTKFFASPLGSNF